MSKIEIGLLVSIISLTVIGFITLSLSFANVFDKSEHNSEN